MRGTFALLVLLLGIVSANSACASPWSVTIYGGPVTDTIFTQVIAGKFKLFGGMVGVAADRRLAYLGWGWNLVGEGQLQVFSFGTNYGAIAAGLGLENHQFPWARYLPTSFSVYMGPSYSLDTPLAYARDLLGSRKALLNYVSLELAFALPHSRHWDTAFRIYHRSGAWGIYTLDADEATVVGVGVRYRF
jgi:hypothetical protein